MNSKDNHLSILPYSSSKIISTSFLSLFLYLYVTRNNSSKGGERTRHSDKRKNLWYGRGMKFPWRVVPRITRLYSSCFLAKPPTMSRFRFFNHEHEHATIHERLIVRRYRFSIPISASLPPPPPPLFSTFQPAPEFARFYFQITLARNSPRNCCHFSRKRAIMQAKPACKHFIFQPVAFLPFETPESGSPDPSRAITISSPPPIRMELLKFLLGGGTISNCYFFLFNNWIMIHG